MPRHPSTRVEETRAILVSSNSEHMWPRRTLPRYEDVRTRAALPPLDELPLPV